MMSMWDNYTRQCQIECWKLIDGYEYTIRKQKHVHLMLEYEEAKHCVHVLYFQLNGDIEIDDEHDDQLLPKVTEIEEQISSQS